MNYKIITILCFAGLLLTSCLNQDKSGPVAVRFYSAITRAVGDSWSAGDKIGIFMTSSDEVSPSTILGGADNTAYVVTTDGSPGLFSPVTASQAITYPNNGSSVTFVAYYPYKSLQNYVLPIDLTDQSNPEMLDIMSAKVSNRSISSPNVSLDFTRSMSNIVVNIASKVYTQSQLNTVVTKVTGLNTQADFAISDRTLKNPRTPAKITTKVTSLGKVYQAILLPGAVAANNATLEFELEGKTLSYIIPTVSFLPGQRYTYNLELGVASVTSLNSSITDWVDETVTNNGTAK